MNLYRMIDRMVARARLRAGCPIVKTHSIYAPAIGAGSVVVDLGANRGDFTREMGQRFGCTCYAVEANPEMVAQIPRDDRTHVHNLAIADRAGAVTLVLSSNHECSSVYSEVASLYNVQGTVECPAVTLEEFLRDNGIAAIDLLKVDIEGAERQLFQATDDATLRAVKQITIEFHDFVPGMLQPGEVPGIRKRLERLGFYCLPFSYMFPSQDTCDFLFVHLKNCSVPWKARLDFFIIKALLHIQKGKTSLKARLSR